RSRVSAIRRGSAEHPREHSLLPVAESDLERQNRCAVVQDIASDGASIGVRLRDATDRRWLAESAAARPAIEASTSQKQPKQTVSGAEALMGTSQNTELVAQGKHREQEV